MAPQGETRCVIASLAVGTRFLRMALGAMVSAERLCGARFDYVIFVLWCDRDLYDVPAFVTLVDLAPVVAARQSRALYADSYRVLTEAEVMRDGFAARELKGLPFVHPDYLDREMVFLDADVIVFEDRFDELFAAAAAQSVATTDSAILDPASPLYEWPHAGWRFNLREEAARAGFAIANRHVHTGLVARGRDDVAKYVSLTFDHLLRTKPLPLFPPNVAYFNDEAYFALALSLAAARFPDRAFEGQADPTIMKTTLHRVMRGLEPGTGKPILGRQDDTSIEDTAYAILHLHTLTTWDSVFYEEWLDQTVPQLLRRGS